MNGLLPRHVLRGILLATLMSCGFPQQLKGQGDTCRKMGSYGLSIMSAEMESQAWLAELNVVLVDLLPVCWPGAQESKGQCGNVTCDI